jgi:pyruvate carboxylase
VLDTSDYLYGLEAGAEHAVDLDRGVRLYVGLEAIGEADDKGLRTVMVRVNGQLRPVFVRDERIAVTAEIAEKADRSIAGHVAAPFSGTVTVKVSAGDQVEAGQVVATIEAMKMEAGITAAVTGRVARLAFSGARGVEAGDLLLVVEE